MHAATGNNLKIYYLYLVYILYVGGTVFITIMQVARQLEYLVMFSCMLIIIMNVQPAAMAISPLTQFFPKMFTLIIHYMYVKLIKCYLRHSVSNSITRSVLGYDNLKKCLI